MATIRAIAAITFKEAVRRKVFLILILFATLVLACTALLPVVNRSEQIHLVEMWTLRILTLFAAIITILIAATSLPGDIQSRRIYTLLSKPVHKASLFLGKTLGFSMLLTVFVFLMGAVSLAYITLLQLSNEGHTKNLLAKPVFTSFRMLAHGRHGIFDKTTQEKTDHRLPADAVTEYSFPEEPDERTRRQIGLEGKDLNAVSWVFSGLSQETVDDLVPVEIKLSLYIGQFLPRGPGRIVVRNPETGKTMDKVHFFSSRIPFKLTFPRELISSSGEVHVQASRQEVGQPSRYYYLLAEPDDVILYGKSHNFWWNYAQGLLLVWFQSMIILTATTMASTFMSAPMSIFFGLAVFLIGNMYGFAQESNTKAERSIQVREEREVHRTHDDPAELPLGLVKTSVAVSRAAMTLLPDFNHFDFSKYLLKDRALPEGTIPSGLMHALVFAGAFSILGIIVMLSKDFS